VKELPVDKFLVTTGFMKLQQSKIDGMKIRNDFKEVIVVDPSTSGQSKQDVFVEIMKKYSYSPQDMLIVGDDPESEIKAAQTLKIDAVLYDKQGNYKSHKSLPAIADFNDLIKFL
jgi:putative hydrolase of the HAD superfamily